MPLAFLQRFRKTRNRIAVVDLGTRMTKAVLIERRNGTMRLLNYVVQDSPVFEGELSPGVIAAHLREVKGALGGSDHEVIFVIGGADSLVRTIELPLTEVSDMRRMIRFSPKHYLQQELANYLFDVHLLKPAVETTPTRKGTKGKWTILVGGAKEHLIRQLQAGARDAGLSVVEITLNQLGAANAFIMGMPENVKDIVALVDIGFKHSTISILNRGELVLNRMVWVGADHFTRGLAESMNITYRVAEGLKLIMPEKVQSKLKAVIDQVGQELKASIDFYEKETSQHVGQVFVSGGSARSQFIVQELQNEFMIPCRAWNPTGFLELAVPEPKKATIEQDAPQMVVAIGAAAGWFNPQHMRINLLAEEQETAEMRRRDPVKRGAWAAAALVLLVLLWDGYLRLKLMMARSEFKRTTVELQLVEKNSNEVSVNAQKTGEIERTLSGLTHLATNRFLWAPPLNALQNTIVDKIQVVRLKTSQGVVTQSGPKPAPGTRIGDRVERISMTLQGRDFGEPPAMNTFIETIAAEPFFKDTLRKTDPIRLKDRLPTQVTQTDPPRSYIPFTIECEYADRPL